MSHVSHVNADAAPDDVDKIEWAKDQHIDYLRGERLEPASDLQVEDSGDGWLKVSGDTIPLRDVGTRAADEGRHRCVLEYASWGDKKPSVQCYEQDNKLWIATYNDDWQVNYCPMCGFKALHQVSEE
jgi:hypothetical protein